MNIGYARTSTNEQNTDLQLDALKKARCEKIFEEKASGAQRDRPQLKAALEYAREGDTIVVNHPGFGGSHLPDVTVISPIFVKAELIGYVANRAHHAEIGGRSPGSMPPAAVNLAEEGVVIPPTLLFDRGEARFDGHPEGWVVFGPDSVHVPTVSDGEMLILYFLPGGEIEFL